MLVETYEVPETAADGSVECEQEAIALIEQLGLEGQRDLITPDTGARCPYRKMTAEEHFVYSRICPQKTALTKYSDGPIPLRVLQVASHALTLSMFDCVQVWHPTSADIKDPVLVGVVGPEYSPREFYILARWGEVLEPMSTLRQLATTIFKGELRSKMRDIVSRATAVLNGIDNLNDDEIVAGSVKIPSYYD